ncbi:MAG TPA: L-rhamnose mutarotase, partial [Streptosporangiaceae bacterium]|nr:L-rhamnose mutarotase [Streptosporangiaceae bacterium]
MGAGTGLLPGPALTLAPAPTLAVDDNASGGAVERVCFLARVRPDRLEEYRAAHRRVWPEMTAALTSAGWANYTIFLAADGLLVGYLETDDYEAALQRMAE